MGNEKHTAENEIIHTAAFTRNEWRRNSIERVIIIGNALRPLFNDDIFVGSRPFEAYDFGFKKATACKLIRVASDPRILAHKEVIPDKWTTAYQITLLSDTEFATALQAGLIRKDTKRSDIESFRSCFRDSGDLNGNRARIEANPFGSSFTIPKKNRRKTRYLIGIEVEADEVRAGVDGIAAAADLLGRKVIIGRIAAKQEAFGKERWDVFVEQSTGLADAQKHSVDEIADQSAEQTGPAAAPRDEVLADAELEAAPERDEHAACDDEGNADNHHGDTDRHRDPRGERSDEDGGHADVHDGDQDQPPERKRPIKPLPPPPPNRYMTRSKL